MPILTHSPRGRFAPRLVPYAALALAVLAVACRGVLGIEPLPGEPSAMDASVVNDAPTGASRDPRDSRGEVDASSEGSPTDATPPPGSTQPAPVPNEGAVTKDAGATAAFVQQATFTYSGPTPTSTYTAHFTNDVTPGNLLVVAFWWQHEEEQGSSVTDTGESAYNQVLVAGESGSNTAWIYSALALRRGPLAVTVSVPTVNAFQFAMVALEYDGATTSESAVTWSSGPESVEKLASYQSSPLTTQRPNELLVALSLVDVISVYSGPHFGARFESAYFCVEDGLAQAPGPYQAGFQTKKPENPGTASDYEAVIGLATFR